MPFDATLLRCPTEKLPLELVDLEEARSIFTPNGAPRTRNYHPDQATPFGVTNIVLIRSDNECAYPISGGGGGIPILLAPERIFPEQKPQLFDLKHPSYEEAYQEMAHYNEVALEQAKLLEERGAIDAQDAVKVLELAESKSTGFPLPQTEWIDATFDCTSQWTAYNHLNPVENARALQVGGSGAHVIKLLLAGAREAWLLTPMYGEAIYAKTLATLAGVVDRLHCVVGVAEELPFADSVFDVVHSGGCIHHTRTEVSFAEIYRVLVSGGRFSAVDPWKAPFHTWGTKLFGKREAGVFCRPMTPQRVDPLFESFETAEVRLFGAIVRYPLLVLNKFGFLPSMKLAWSIYKVDEWLCGLLKPLRGWGSSVTILATKD